VRVLLKITAAAGILLIIACGNQQDTGLDVSVTPDRPVMIPYGTGTTVSNWFKLTPGYFTLTSINLKWRGTGTLNVIAIVLQSPDVISGGTTGGTTGSGSGMVSVACNFAGDDLGVIYSSLKDSNGNIMIPATTTPVFNSSAESGCGGISLPSPIPQSFNTPVQVKVIGAVVDSTNNTVGRATATANIVIQ
jgi:hypothetical protein